MTNKTKLIISILLLATLTLAIFYVLNLKKIENVEYCQGDICFGTVKVYKNANTQKKCDVIGGRYEPMYIIPAKQDTGYCHVE